MFCNDVNYFFLCELFVYNFIYYHEWVNYEITFFMTYLTTLVSSK